MPNNLNEQFMRFVEQHIREELTVQEMADAFGYSKFHFCRLFRESMNISVMEYVSKRKLAASLDEIVQGKRIIDVAFEFGWQSHSSFTKSFRKEFGISPSVAKTVCFTIANLGGSIMSEIKLNRTTGTETKEQLAEILLGIMKENQIEYDESFQTSIAYAYEAYDGRKSYSGADHVTLTLNVAILLAHLEAEAEVIEAGMFCDAFKRGTNFDMAKLPKRVQEILTEIKGGNFSEISEEALLVKTAERLHNMRTVDVMPEEKKKRKIEETMNVFLPIARRLGNNQLVEEINDLVIQYL